MTNKPNQKQKIVLRELVNFLCQNCGKHERICGILECHRIKRGNVGGLYTPNNILVVCHACHRKFHEMEFK